MAFFPAPKVTRAMLEYPTYNVSFAYLAAINKLMPYAGFAQTGATSTLDVITADIFTDRALRQTVASYTDCPHLLVARFQSSGNTYANSHVPGASTADHRIVRISSNAETALATESVDLSTRAPYDYVFSVSGSTLKSSRTGGSSFQISATDTTWASGYFGFAVGRVDAYANIYMGYATMLLLPFSPLPDAIAVVEVEVEKQEEKGVPAFGPALERELVEVERLQGLPAHLYLEAKRYRILRAKGFTDEEIELVFGYVPQHQVDLAAVTWGAFEFSPDSPTNVIVVTGDNPYRQGAVERQVERARRKSLKALKPPKTYQEAVEMYKRLSREFKHWLAGKDNFAYQVLGHEWLEPMAVADFYHGELVDHRTHYSQIKQVPDGELWFILDFWEARLDRHKDVLPSGGYESHKRKFAEIKKRGW